MAGEPGSDKFIPRLASYKAVKIRIPRDPFRLFWRLFKKALKSEFEANAAVLATNLNARYVLVKKISPSGFIFFTSKYSFKYKEISKDSRVILLFYWPTLGVQVRLKGRAKEVAQDLAEEYFLSRPFESQVATLISKQSRFLKDRKNFENFYSKTLSKFQGSKLSVPKHWSGFSIVPQSYEFLFLSQTRLHRRVLYKKTQHSWVIRELYP